MGGVSVNSMDMDDFRGSFCNLGTYPFLKWSLGLLANGNKPLNITVQSTTTSTEQPSPTTTKKRAYPSAPPRNQNNPRTTSRNPFFYTQTNRAAALNRNTNTNRQMPLTRPSFPTITYPKTTTTQTTTPSQ